ncbi:hydroxyacylglutathione hydrolase [Microvirga pudoricolor]|uniref:hydroxyacylglutathione hydrolase n=1 Tax=Microvirga pudoricolor TaxID=2778729 RepID=UPI00194FACD3|nr:hydroxyacylglutathione hydrolase [Microvirga pudoricolor]MBM6593374.1 hydroxyacylglutathione hydrolase [Microvirga pudoricolor]
MPAQVHAFLCLQDNIGALIHDPNTGACAAIDAPEEAPILAALAETGWQLTDILVTHRHSDHVQGIEALKARTGCRVVAPSKARAQVPQADAYVQEGDTVHVGDLQAHVWETPGHCSDHVSYWFAADRVLFCGDTLFTLGCGRVLDGSYPDLWHSLQRLAALPEEASVYSGHDYVLSNGRFALAVEPGNAALKARMEEAETARAEGTFLVPSTIGAERATNPFLRAGEAGVAKAVNLDAGDPFAVFKALREWKNRF